VIVVAEVAGGMSQKEVVEVYRRQFVVGVVGTDSFVLEGVVEGSGVGFGMESCVEIQGARMVIDVAEVVEDSIGTFLEGNVLGMEVSIREMEAKHILVLRNRMVVVEVPGGQEKDVVAFVVDVSYMGFVA
jgi:hypothetical protein